LYLALYRKYRPRTFEDVVSQPHITRTLKNEVASGKTAHAYLFTGPRGTGKTTCSKILAMAVNCEHPKDGNPCLACDACRGIEQGSVLDVVEIDAASNNGVDNIRQLRDEASYTPSQCRYRVYIIDETHMLSPGAFNALLKIMEEPPPHVKFILATTEAHKVPATILSRCQRFDFRRIRPEDIRDRLLKIADNEPFTLSPEAAGLIARLADGGMRDAISLLDQCAAFCQEITPETVSQAAGVVGKTYIYSLADCILSQDAGEAVSMIDRLYAMSKDMQGLLEEMIHYFRNLMLTMTLKSPEALTDALPEEFARLREHAGKIPLSGVLLCLSEMQETLDKMSRSFDRRLLLELCFVKLCTPSMHLSDEGVAARLERLEAKLGALCAGSAPIVGGAVPAQDMPPQVVPPKELLPEESSSGEAQVRRAETQASEPPEAAAPETAPSEGARPAPWEDELPAASQAAPPVKAERPSRHRETPKAAEAAPSGFQPAAEWADILSSLRQNDLPLYGVLQGSRAFVQGDSLYVDSPMALTAQMLRQEGNAARLIAAIEKKTGRRYRIRVKSAAPKAKESDGLASLLDRARQAGVEVREEN